MARLYPRGDLVEMVKPQLGLFGEPDCDPEQSQWFTPPWICRRMAAWVPLGSRILEPCCGSGNIIDALLRSGHPAKRITAIEKDPRFAAVARERFAGEVSIVEGDFFDAPRCLSLDIVVMNSPFEENALMRFVLRALEIAPLVISLGPVSFECSVERDSKLWRTRAMALRRARMPYRVKYGGATQPLFDSQVLLLGRRKADRTTREVRTVTEEVWLPDGDVSDR